MIDASGRVVEFYLTAEGRKVLRGIVPSRGPFQALVIATDELGPVVLSRARGPREETVEAIPAMLMRWDYIVSMTFPYTEEGEPPRVPVGFTAR